MDAEHVLVQGLFGGQGAATLVGRAPPARQLIQWLRGCGGHRGGQFGAAAESKRKPGRRRGQHVDIDPPFQKLADEISRAVPTFPAKGAMSTAPEREVRALPCRQGQALPGVGWSPRRTVCAPRRRGGPARAWFGT